MTYYRTPMLLDAFRLTGDTVEETIGNIVQHLLMKPGGFSYTRAANHIQKAYHGYHDFSALARQCRGDGSSKAKVQNARVVEIVAPLASGRSIQTFQFPKRGIALAHGIICPLGPRFFFVEKGVTKVFYLHCRMDHRANIEHLASVTQIYKSEILDNDFYGLDADVELVDLLGRGDNAKITRHNLDSLSKFIKEDPLSVLSRFVQAFREVDEGRLAGARRERAKSTPDERQKEFDI